MVITFPYGIFRYPDHKEPLYLEPVLRLLEDGYSVERIELVERWVGIVARAARPGSETATARTWARGLEIAEARLADADATLEQRWESLKNTQSRLTETEQRLAAAEGRLAFPEEQAEGAGESPREAAMLRQRLRETRDELELAQERIAFISSEREALEQALLAADARAASLAGELATAEVELEDARERLRSDRLDPDGSPGAVGADALRDGRHEAAAAAFRLAAEREPGVAGNWLGLGRALRGLKRLTDAQEAFERALELHPGLRDAQWQSLWVLSRLDRTAGFEELAASLGPPERLRADELQRLAPLALRAGAHELARSIGERLLATEPLSQTGLETTASAHWELGDEGRAAEIIDRGLATGDPRAVRAALGFMRHTDDLERVPGLLETLDPPEVALLVEFAQVFLRRGQPVIARDLIDRAATLAPGDPLVDDVRRRAQDDLRVHDGSWVRPHPRRRVERQPGRVLHLVSPSLPHHTSGGTYRTHHIARAQRDLGLDPQVVTPLGFPWGDGVVGAREADVLDGIEYIRIPDDDPADAALPERMGRNLDRLVPLVEALRPAVLHPASDYLNALLALELRKLFDIPVVYEVRGFPEERQVRRGGSRACSDQGVGRRAMELGCMHAADRIVTLAEVMKRHIVSRGVPAEKIHIVPNGVDLDALRPVPRDRALAARLGIEDDETVLGYVSTFHGYEGIQFIVRAVAELIGRGRRVRALLVGDGREREPLERLAAELGIGGAVVFTGRVPHDEVLRYYSLIDLFVVPRRAEATSELVTPLKPYEAMAAERPVIVSDVAALREMIRDGETGRRFRPEDHVHLADVADELIADPAARRRLAVAGREWVTAERAWSRVGAGYRTLYEELGAA